MKNFKYQGWYTFDDRFVSFVDVSHQHLSNALWFNEVFNAKNRYNSDFMFELGMVLHKRFEGIRLPWAPLPIPKEIQGLRDLGLIQENGDIIGNCNTTLFEGRVIGNINHIKQDDEKHES